MKQDPEYYEGAMDGFQREVSRLNKSFSSFGTGRVAQWNMLIEDYRAARARIEELEERLRSLGEDWTAEL